MDGDRVTTYDLAGSSLSVNSLEAIVYILNTTGSVKVVGCGAAVSLLELGVRLASLSKK